jgi:hypothetical protein
MMRKGIFVALIALIAIESIAQVRPARKREYDKFFNSTSYVVEDGNPFSMYNPAMKAAIEKHWHLTPVKFITFDEFQRMRTDEDASFMILAEIKQKNLNEIYEFINFVMGSKSRDFENMPDLGSVPLAYRGADDENYLYKMGAFVKFMQTYVQEQSSTPRIRLATRFFNVKDDRLKNMELWLLEEELAPEIDTEDKISKYYPHRVRITTRKEIEKAIDEDRGDVAFLHKIGPEDNTSTGRGKCWKFVVSAKDGRVLYSAHHDVDRQIPDALLVSDLQQMAE